MLVPSYCRCIYSTCELYDAADLDAKPAQGIHSRNASSAEGPSLAYTHYRVGRPTSTPSSCARLMVAAESGRGGSSMEMRPMRRQLAPPSSDCATPSEPQPPRGALGDVRLHGPLLPLICQHLADDLQQRGQRQLQQGAR
jgi:hypothetical protein